MQAESKPSYGKKTNLIQVKKLIPILGLGSLALYISSNLSHYINVSSFFEYFFVLLFIACVSLRPWQLKNDVIIRLIALSIFVPLFFFAINYFSNPELAKKYFLFENLVRLMMFSAAGFWLGGNLKKIHLFLLFTLGCSLLALFNDDVVVNFTNIFNGNRTNSGIGNAQYTVNLYGILIIGLICFYKDFASYFEKKIKLMILYLIILTVCLIIFTGAKTRAGILGLDIAYAISIIHLLYILKKKRTSIKQRKIFLTYAFTSFLFLAFSTHNILNTRNQNDNQVVQQLANKDFDNIKMTSFGIRVNSWIEASNWIKERPAHGWGGKVNSYVFELSNFPDRIKQFGHFHNSFIEFTLAYGVIGLSIILFLFYWINRKIYLLSKASIQYNGVWLFTFYGSIYALFINLFESYLFYSIGVYTTVVLFAPAYSLYLENLTTHRKKT